MKAQEHDQVLERFGVYILNLSLPLTPETFRGVLKNHGARGITDDQIAQAIKMRVVEYMRSTVHAHLDTVVGEVNLTRLAEDACQRFKAYGPEPQCEIPQDYFEWAFEVAQWYDSVS